MRRNSLIKKMVLLMLFFTAFYIFPVLADEPSSAKPEIVSGTDNNGLQNATLIILAAWFGIAAYLFRLDRRISKLEKELHEE